MYDDNRRRRELNRIKNKGSEKRGRPVHRHNKRLISDEEWEFCQAIERYKKSEKIRFLTFSEILHVVKTLGYKK